MEAETREEGTRRRMDFKKGYFMTGVAAII